GSCSWPPAPQRLSLTVARLAFPRRRRPPPTSTLFPYTTLFRSDQTGRRYQRRRGTVGSRDLRETYSVCGNGRKAFGSGTVLSGRSEEHTSELQSRFDLVCRLLLEKKKDKRHDTTTSARHTPALE